MWRKWRDSGWMPALLSWALGERRGEEGGQEGAEQREKKGEDERGEEKREMGTVCMEKKGEREGGRDGNEATGVLRTSRDQKVGRGAVWFIKTSERPDLWAGGWMWRGSLVVAQRGTDGKWHDRIFSFFFFFSFLGSGTCCPYQVSLAHNILPGEKELKRGEAGAQS